MFSYFKGSVLFTCLATCLGFFYGGFPAALIVLVLGVLEVSLSFDNAVVNATVLKNWDQAWRSKFVTFGMPVAVFGMRFLFPLLIVAVIGHLGPIDVVKMAFQHPDEYAKQLVATHIQVAAFGGAFLMMVALKYFMDAEKDEHWLSVIEKPLAKMGSIDAIQEALTIAAIAAISLSLDSKDQIGFLFSGIWGVVTFILVKGLGGLLSSEEDTGTKMVQQGIMGFIYLEVLDASFSFDGVIGAFAITNQLVVIALGLGVGAMFVRSLTLMLVDKGTLDTYKYLEPAAFWAISALTVIMFLSVKHEIPEVVTGLIGAGLIGAGFVHSILANKKTA